MENENRIMIDWQNPDGMEIQCHPSKTQQDVLRKLNEAIAIMNKAPQQKKVYQKSDYYTNSINQEKESTKVVYKTSKEEINIGEYIESTEYRLNGAIFMHF
ncbi:hypothetical protein [Oceanobacillus damuensis]|uniref:hypothetical protein n=1 Tax=Oceanobacillus damuensis TaxID=937928 RepID=UPI000833270A|nr:hypothetical protein [Oceanobacillus damuensis]